MPTSRVSDIVVESGVTSRTMVPQEAGKVRVKVWDWEELHRAASDAAVTE
jgi:hypothetical protein